MYGQDVALVDPDLARQCDRRWSCLAEAVVDVGAERVQRHTAFAVPLGTSHFGTAEATRALDADAECAGLLSVLHGALHGTAERDTTSELIGDALSDQGSIELGLLDLLDVELNLGVTGDRREAGAQGGRLRSHGDR